MKLLILALISIPLFSFASVCGKIKKPKDFEKTIAPMNARQDHVFLIEKFAANSKTQKEAQYLVCKFLDDNTVNTTELLRTLIKKEKEDSASRLEICNFIFGSNYLENLKPAKKAGEEENEVESSAFAASQVDGFCSDFGLARTYSRLKALVEEKIKSLNSEQAKTLRELNNTILKFAKGLGDEYYNTGTGYSQFSIDREENGVDFFTKILSAIFQKQAPPQFETGSESDEVVVTLSKQNDLKKSDAYLNKVFNLLMNSEKTVGKKKIKETQREWIKLKGKFVNFAKSYYPDLKHNELEFVLTMQRIDGLLSVNNLDGEGPIETPTL